MSKKVSNHPAPPPPRVFKNNKQIEDAVNYTFIEKLIDKLFGNNEMKKESWKSRFTKTWASTPENFKKDADNLSSYNPCGGYQPKETPYPFKNPPLFRGLSPVTTNTPMPKVKPPKDEDAPETWDDFAKDQIKRYERVYLEAMKAGASPDDAKRHADNVVSQALRLYYSGSIEVKAENL